MAIQLGAVVEAIAALSITGVTVLDTDQIPENAEFKCPLLMARGDLASGWTFERKTFGTGSTAFGVVRYLVNLRYLYAPAGSNLALSSVYPTMVSYFENIVDTILDNDSLASVAKSWLAGVDSFGIVLDPTGRAFYGCDFSILIEEYDNA